LLGVCVAQALLFWLAAAREEVAGVAEFEARYAHEPSVLGLSVVISAWAGL
jgi:hypothetical protein